jgi:hypothetical protein
MSQRCPQADIPGAKRWSFLRIKGNAATHYARMRDDKRWETVAPDFLVNMHLGQITLFRIGG